MSETANSYKYRIEYKDPITEEIKVITKIFEDTFEIPAKEWAEDFAYALADKGWYEITLLEKASCPALSTL